MSYYDYEVAIYNYASLHLFYPELVSCNRALSHSSDVCSGSEILTCDCDFTAQATIDPDVPAEIIIGKMPFTIHNVKPEGHSSDRPPERVDH